jgi:hypothetical protein
VSLIRIRRSNPLHAGIVEHGVVVAWPTAVHPFHSDVIKAEEFECTQAQVTQGRKDEMGNPQMYSGENVCLQTKSDDAKMSNLGSLSETGKTVWASRWDACMAFDKEYHELYLLRSGSGEDSGPVEVC